MTEAEILASLVKRIEAVREEKKLLAGSERDLFAEAKGKHIDGKALRRVLQRRAMDDADREAFDDLVDQYEQALGSKATVRAAVASGLSVRQAAKIAGVTHGVAERAARGVPKNANGGTAVTKSGADACTRKGQVEAGTTPMVDAGHKVRSSAPDTPHPESGAVAAPPAPSPQGSVEHPPRAAAPDTDEHWEKRDGEGNYLLALQVANGKLPHPASKTTAELVAALDGDPGLIDRRRA